MRSLFLVLASLATAMAFVPAGPMTMPLQHRSASVSGLQMKALNKPARLAEVRRKYNKHHKSEMRTFIKKTLVAIESGDYAVASPLLSKTQSCIDKNVKRGRVGGSIRGARLQPRRRDGAAGRPSAFTPRAP